jgi:hypothetical protein
VEAYKIADILAREEVSASIWADWWGFKMEALDATNANAAIVHRAGARAVIHSDDAMGIQRLNQEAAKALAAGREAGIEISDDEALRWITYNAAWALGLQDEIGTLEPGQARRRGDLVRPPVQRLLARGEGVRRRRAALRPQLDPRGSTRPTSSWASSPGGSAPMSMRIQGAAALAAAGLLAAAPAAAQGVVAIEGGTVHTMSGAAIEGGTVLIRDGRIVAVGRDVAVPAGARRIDARGRHVTPGFIESGTQIGLVEVGAVAGSVDTQMLQPGDALRDAGPRRLQHRRRDQPRVDGDPVTRIAGVTTAVSRPSGGLISGQGVVIDLDGRTVDQMLVRSPVAMFARTRRGRVGKHRRLARRGDAAAARGPGGRPRLRDAAAPPSTAANRASTRRAGWTWRRCSPCWTGRSRWWWRRTAPATSWRRDPHGTRLQPAADPDRRHRGVDGHGSDWRGTASRWWCGCWRTSPAASSGWARASRTRRCCGRRGCR